MPAIPMYREIRNRFALVRRDRPCNNGDATVAPPAKPKNEKEAGDLWSFLAQYGKDGKTK